MSSRREVCLFLKDFFFSCSCLELRGKYSDFDSATLTLGVIKASCLVHRMFKKITKISK